MKLSILKQNSSDKIDFASSFALLFLAVCSLFLSFSLIFDSFSAIYFFIMLAMSMLFSITIIKKSKKTSIIIAVIFPILFVVFHNVLIGFFAAMLNKIQLIMFEKYAFSVHFFDSSGTSFAAKIIFFSCLSLLFSWIFFSDSKILKAVFLLLMIAFVVFLGDILSVALAIFCSLMMIFYNKKRSFLDVMARSFVIISALFIFISAQFIQVFSKKITMNISNSVYGGDGFQLPMGDLSDSKPFRPKGFSSLEVVMDTPEAMYLHGFLGYNYSDGNWQTADYSQFSEYSEKLAYLDAQGFTANSQTVIFAENFADEFSFNNVTVTNLGANSSVYYTPATAKSDASPRFFSSGGLENQKKSGEKTPVSSQTIEDFIQNSSSFSNKYHDENDLLNETFISNSAIFDEIYTQNFTKLPDNINRILDTELAKYDVERGNLNDIANVIYDYLGGFSYDIDASNLNLEQFLQTSKSGYSIHFASAATEIFRYYGIPARYAEGYIVDKNAVKNKLSGSPITLTDADFHAWTEYYLTGIGWIPFESTPDYFDKMPLPNGVSAEKLQELTQKNAAIQQGNNVVSGERIADKIVDDEEQTKNYYLIFAFVPLFLAAIILGVRVLYTRNKLKYDASFALQTCFSLLNYRQKRVEMANGIYDFSALSDDLQSQLDDFQSSLMEKMYSNHSAVQVSDSLVLYKSVKKSAFADLNCYQKFMYTVKVYF